MGRQGLTKAFKGDSTTYEDFSCSCCGMSKTHAIDPGSRRWRCIACGKRCTPYLGELDDDTKRV